MHVPLLLGCWLLLACLSSAAIAQADVDAATAERRIKAAFVYRFASYVEWPAATFATPDASFAIGVEGDERMADELTRIVAGRSVGGRAIVIRRVARETLPDGLQILFAADVGDGWLSAGAAGTKPVLVVTATEDALAHGSTINLMVIDEHVRFEVSTADADRRGLRLSARLLAIAQRVLAEKS